MEVKLNILIKLLQFISNEAPTSRYNKWIKHNVMTFFTDCETEEIFAHYLQNTNEYKELVNYIKQNNINIILQDNTHMDNLRNAIKASGIIPILNSNHFLMLKQGYVEEYITNVDATIIFRNDKRRLHLNEFGNVTFEYYSLEEHTWKFIGKLEESELKNDVLYKFTQNDNGSLSYVIFIDSNYLTGSVNTSEFVNERLNTSYALLREMLGTHSIETIAMSGVYMNNPIDDRICLPIMLEHAITKLTQETFIKRVIMVDQSSTSFEKHYLDNYANPESNNFINLIP